MGKKLYFKSDGNGGLIIGKTTLAILVSLVALLSAFATVVAQGAALKNEVAHNTADIEILKEDMVKHIDQDAVMRTDIANIKDILNEINKKLDGVAR